MRGNKKSIYDPPCPVCVKEGKTSSIVRHGPITTGLRPSDKLIHLSPVSFEDEEGRHTHDPHTNVQTLWCANGHKFYNAWTPRCWCGWPGELEEARV